MIKKKLFHTTSGNKTSVVIATNPNLKNLITRLNEKTDNKVFYFNPQNGNAFFYSPALNYSRLKSLKSLIILNQQVEAGHV